MDLSLFDRKYNNDYTGAAAIELEDLEPHYTTIPNFVSWMSGEIEKGWYWVDNIDKRIEIWIIKTKEIYGKF